MDWAMGRILVLVSVCLLAPLATATATQAGAVRESVPVSFVVTNPCNGEAVAATGTVEFVMNELDNNPSVAYIAAENARYDVTAIGMTTGVTYVLQDVLHVSTVISDFTTFAPTQSTLTELFHLVSRGGAPDFRALAIVHVTFTADGTLTASVQLTPQACRG